MHEQDIAIVKALVPVAWADGNYADKERETIEALLVAYEATPEEKKAVHDFAAHNCINVQDLSAHDRRVLLQHAVLVTFADGDQSADEVAFLKQMAERLRIPEDEAKAVMDSAAERAKKHLHLL
jgi:tellurite resistance protein